MRKSPLGRVFEHSVLDRVRSRLLHMGGNDLHQALDALQGAGVPAWVGGGWGVDALLGSQTRRHSDIDLLIDCARDGERRASEALAPLGYTLAADQGEVGAVLRLRRILRDPSGRTIELLFFRGDEGGPDTAPHLLAAAFTVGEVGGRPVPCLSAPEQLRLHSAYEPADHDRKDVELLCRRFDLPLPSEYRAK
jgi:lincosamide nucleotidyltransferase A/C/D/E